MSAEHGDTHPDEGSEQPDFGALSGDTGQVGPEAETAADQAAANMGDSIVPHGREEPGSDEVVLPGEVLRDTPHTTNDAGGIDPEDYIPDISEGRQSGTETGQPSQPADTGKTVPEAVEDNGKEDGMGFVWHTGDKEADETGDLTVTDILHEDSGKALSDVCDTALRIITGSSKTIESTISQGGDSLRQLSWQSADHQLHIKITSSASDDPQNDRDTAGHLTGDEDLLSEVTNRLCTTGPAYLEVTTTQNVPIIYPGNSTGIVGVTTVLRYKIPDLEGAQIDWLDVTPYYTDSGGKPAEALGEFVKHSATTEGLPLEDRLVELDTELISDVHELVIAQADKLDIIKNNPAPDDKANSVTTPSPAQAAAERDIKLQELDRDTKSNIKNAFEALDDMDGKRPLEDNTDQIAVISEMEHDARKLVSDILKHEVPQDNESAAGTIASMASLAAMRGDLAMVQGYCEIMELIPETPQSALARAYSSAARLGDVERLSDLHDMLAEERSVLQDNLQYSAGYTPDILRDRTVLVAAVNECISANESPLYLIDEYTALTLRNPENGQPNSIVDTETKWLLQTLYYNSLKSKGEGAQTAPLLDDLCQKLIKNGLNGLRPEFACNYIPEAFKFTEDRELRVKLVQRFLELSNHVPGNKIFGPAVDLGLAILADSENSTMYPGLATELDKLAYKGAKIVKPRLESTGRYWAFDTYMDYHIRVKVSEGTSPDMLIAEIDRERDRREHEIIKDSNAGEIFTNLQIKTAGRARDIQLATAAKLYAQRQNFLGSGRFITSMTTARNGVYTVCWAMAKTKEQVQSLFPEELIYYSEETPQQNIFEGLEIDAYSAPDISEMPIDTKRAPATKLNKQLLADLYATALITTSDDIKILAEHAKNVAGSLPSVGISKLSKQDIECIRFQRSVLLNRIRTIDRQAARDLAAGLVKNLLSNTMHNYSTDLETYYPYLEYDLVPDYLELIREAILKGAAKSTDRAAFLTNYTTRLLRKKPK